MFMRPGGTRKGDFFWGIFAPAKEGICSFGGKKVKKQAKDGDRGRKVLALKDFHAPDNGKK